MAPCLSRPPATPMPPIPTQGPKRWQSGDWEPSRGWGPCPCLTQGLQFPVTPTLPSRLRLLGTGWGELGTGFFGAPTACQTLALCFSGILQQPSGRVRGENRPRGEQAPPGHLAPWQPPSFLSCRDRKKKRFVGQSGQEDKKKIKTESGRYISSSYKRDLYPEGWG